MADKQFFHRLKAHGISDQLSTVIVSSKKFTSEDLQDWAIDSLASLKPQDAINIIRDLHFNPNVGDKKSGVLCAKINNFKKSSQEEANQQGGQGRGQHNPRRGQGSARGGNNRGRGGGGPPIVPLMQTPLCRPPPQYHNSAPLLQTAPCRPPPRHSGPIFHPPSAGRSRFQTHRGSSVPNEGLLENPHERKKQQPIQTNTQYLNNNLDYLMSLSEDAKGIRGFASPAESHQYQDDDGASQTSSTGRKTRGKRSKREGAKKDAKGDDSDDDSDGSVQSTPDYSRMAGNRGLNRSYGSTDFLNARPQRGSGNADNQYSRGNQGIRGNQGNRGNQEYRGNQGNRGYQENRGNRGPRRGRGGGRGHHDNSSEIVDINIDDNNQGGESPGGNRGQGRGRGRTRGNQRGRGMDRGRRGSARQNSGGNEREDEDSDSDSGSELSSMSGSEASRSLIYGSQDLQGERLQDFDDAKKKRRPRQKPRARSLNEEMETLEDDSVDENKIFSYLVKSCGGFIAFDEFVKECDLIPGDLDINRWFRCHKRRFKLFEKEGIILYISAFYRDVTLCLGYNCLFGRAKICSKTDCEHFHICKNYISGNCSFGETCCYSHSFRDASNLEHKKKLGLFEFSDKEMVVILGNRYPRICSDFLKTTSCPIGETCPNLHMCSLSLRGRCTREADCPLGHSFETDHNKWVLQALEYHMWLNGRTLLLKKIVLVDRSLEAPLGVEAMQKEEPEIGAEALKDIADEIEALKKKPGQKRVSRANRFQTDDPDDVLSFNLNQVHISKGGSSVDPDVTEEPMPEPAEKAESKPSKTKTKKPPKPKQNKQDVKVDTPVTWLDDAADDIPICVKHVEGNCRGVCPKGHHHHPDQAPYVWQIKHGDNWCSFRQEYSEEIEEGFCKHLEVIDAEILVEEQAAYMVHVCVSDARNAKGVVYEQDGVMLQDPHSLPVRRLSTQSYVDVKDKKIASSPAFTTQWRWFWKNDEEQWKLFDTDNFQKTLERKYRYAQPTYLFTRNNYRFKYRIDFRTFRQVNLDTMKTHDLCRRPLFVSLEDVTNKKFPDCLEVTDPISKPSNFAPWDLSNDFELVELDRFKPEFKTLCDRFFETMDSGRFSLLYIYRVQNCHLYQDYELRKKNMKKEIELEDQSHDVNEKLLFHGTDSMKTCQGICTNNFDFRTSGKNATMYGEGSYFAETSKYSHSYTQPGTNKERYMFQAKVLVGLYTLGNGSYRRPPERPDQTHKLYDSCVDNGAEPNMYIIFERSQSYPEYLIAYREKSTSDHATARVGVIHAVSTQGVSPAVTVKPSTLKSVAPPAPKPSAPPVPEPHVSRAAPPVPAPHVSRAAPPIPAQRVSRAAPPATAPLPPLVYPGMAASSYPTEHGYDVQERSLGIYSQDNIRQSASPTSPERGYVAQQSSFGTYGQDTTQEQLKMQYYIEDQLERKRRVTEYATNIAKQKEMTPQQKKKDDGCILQ